MMKILFVCMGNICRSPTAEGAMRRRLEEQGLHELVRVDSAGTHGYHVGEPPDIRTQRAAKARGLDLSRLRGRQVAPRDFDEFDLILAMDGHNLELLKQQCPSWHQAKLKRLLEYRQAGSEADVPDPYYGGPKGFELVLDLVDEAVQGLIEDLKRQGLGAGRKTS
ncbi:MAG: low molecular weight phosphotyrosine protein phosphatase [Rhodocyclaceae bacterium]|nr:low molecular weight phosphotyrosine protein phosphatase [Rhodocyclaceae bacterium]